MSFASRTIVVAWWFVVLVLISSYTAQLAASLTTESIAREVNSINDLTNQDYIQYGTVNNSEVQEFFRSSNITTYRSALPTIRNNLHSSADVAVDEVCESKGTFAFIWDSVVIESFIAAKAKYCSLCSIAILKLRESQFLFTLRNKWISTATDSTCKGFSKLSYSVTDIGDAFVVLAICLVVSVIVLVFEILWKYHKISQKVKVSLCCNKITYNILYTE